MTRGQKWRRRRNLVMFAAVGRGISPVFLADVFDLSDARVRVIITRLRIESGLGIDDASIEARSRWVSLKMRNTYAARGTGGPSPWKRAHATQLPDADRARRRGRVSAPDGQVGQVEVRA